MTTAYPTLRQANAARQAIWDDTGMIDWSWRVNELAGEAGEVCNVLKKIRRERMGIRGSRATINDLAEELADVVICADLCLMHMDRVMLPQAYRMFIVGDSSLTDLGMVLAREVGRLARCPHVDHVPRSTKGNNGSIHRATAVAVLTSIVAVAHGIAKSEGIDLDAAVARKFNVTSVKVGLPVMMLEAG